MKDKKKAIKKIDRKIRETQKLQAEVDRRKKVEQKAEELICQCKFKEAIELLSTLD